MKELEAVCLKLGREVYYLQDRCTAANENANEACSAVVKLMNRIDRVAAVLRFTDKPVSPPPPPASSTEPTSDSSAAPASPTSRSASTGSSALDGL